MKILLTGATGYIGGAAAKALLARGHEVHGLARSSRAEASLREHDITPVRGDFSDPASLARAVHTCDPDAVVSTASVGSLGGDAATYARDRDSVIAMRDALGDSGKTLIFTSGSAVLGTFNGGNATKAIHDEETALPLPASEFAPASAGVHPMIAAGLGAAMVARVETEQAVTTDRRVRGIVVRPGLVYGHGGSFDIPSLIKLSRHHGHGVHLGPGATIHSYVHLDDLAELYCLAVEKAPHGAVLHAVTDDVSQRELAAAVSRMMGMGDRTESLTMAQMLRLNLASRIGLGLTARLPSASVHKLQGVFKAPDSVGTGISLCLHKRLSADRTRQLLGWSPTRTDIIEDIGFGSYAAEVGHGTSR
jgi:nucleoside-diphosphate-sugar epimerase